MKRKAKKLPTFARERYIKIFFKMRLKYFLHALCCWCIIGFTSCLGDDEVIEYTLSTDAQFFTFKLANDSISTELALASYTIDQIKGEIYNKDSLSFGLIPLMEQLPKAIFSYTTAITDGGNVCLIAANNADSTFINSGDSISLLPFLNIAVKHLRVYATNGTTKDYTINLRVHTIDPDSMVYESVSDNLPFPVTIADSEAKTILLNGKFYCFGYQSSVLKYASSEDAVIWSLPTTVSGASDIQVQSISLYKDRLYARTASGDLYSSANAADWTPVSLSSPDGIFAAAKVIAVLGETQDISVASSNALALLSLVLEEDNERFFVKTDLNHIWIKGDNVPADFPVTDFISVSWTKQDSYMSNLMLVDGASNAIWRTQGDTLTGWTKLSAPRMAGGGVFTIPQSSNILYYNNELLLINGANNYTAYASIDGGLTWKDKKMKYAPPITYSPREKASVCVKDHFIYIFGGEYKGDVLRDVWRARLNKFGFEN
jgi:hypothetical protein